MSIKRYSIGIDVGKNSTGLAAIELDNENNPIRILNAQSVIHDGGVDPSAQKEGNSRLFVSGCARRARRLQRQRRRHLHKLDLLLTRLGYPSTDGLPFEHQPFAEWQCRAQLANQTIADPLLRKTMMAIAIRHIARHRGWRNPYSRVTSLHNISARDLSDEYRILASKTVGTENSNQTPAQLVMHYVHAHAGKPAPRLRHGLNQEKKPVDGIIPSRLRQEDNAYELRIIGQKQGLKNEDINTLIDTVFDAKSPRGSAEKRVGKDPFNNKPRALKPHSSSKNTGLFQPSPTCVSEQPIIMTGL